LSTRPRKWLKSFGKRVSGKVKNKTWKSQRAGAPNSFVCEVPLKRQAGWEFWVLLFADNHWDNPHSDLEMQRRHLGQVKERGGAAVGVGDLFCLMQGKFDKRGSKASVRPEHNTDNYFDTVIEDAAQFFRPYAKNIISVGVGNHEAEVKKRIEICPTERFISLLNYGKNANVYNGGYSGYVRFLFKDGPYASSTVLQYFHGSGGAANAGGGVAQMYGDAGYYPDADIMCSGHNHHGWFREFSRQRLLKTGEITYDIQTHIKIPTYKHAVGTGVGGFEVEKNLKARPLGGWWIRFYWDRPSGKVIYDLTRAR